MQGARPVFAGIMIGKNGLNKPFCVRFWPYRQAVVAAQNLRAVCVLFVCCLRAVWDFGVSYLHEFGENLVAYLY